MIPPDGSDLAPVDEELVDALTRNVMFAADDAVLNGGGWSTTAEMTRVAVRAAIANGVRNRAITIAPLAEWPEWWSLDDQPRGGPR